MILPPDFLFRMEQQLGSEMPAFLAAMDQPPVRGIRIHEKKAGADLFQRDLPEPVPWSDHGYYLSRGPSSVQPSGMKPARFICRILPP